MNILEIGIQHGIEQGMERGIKQGMELGRQQGVAAGEHQKLTELVQKKLMKGYSVAEIAEMLEESEETIREIVNESNVTKA